MGRLTEAVIQQIAKMNRDKMLIAFNRSKQDVQQLKCCTVHPLMVDHYAAQA